MKNKKERLVSEVKTNLPNYSSKMGAMLLKQRFQET